MQRAVFRPAYQALIADDLAPSHIQDGLENGMQFTLADDFPQATVCHHITPVQQLLALQCGRIIIQPPENESGMPLLKQFRCRSRQHPPPLMDGFGKRGQNGMF